MRLEASAAPLGASGGATGPADLTIYDLSRDGFLIDARSAWSVGDGLRITLASVGTVEATIARAERDLLGCTFTMPLSMAELDRCTAASTVVWPDFVDPPGQAGRAIDAPFGGDIWRTRQADGVEEEPERWPRRVRAGIAVGGGLLLWGLIALALL